MFARWLTSRVGHNAVPEGLKSGCRGVQPAVLAAVVLGSLAPPEAPRIRGAADLGRDL
jgi:hypothetical protein